MNLLEARGVTKVYGDPDRAERRRPDRAREANFTG